MDIHKPCCHYVATDNKLYKDFSLNQIFGWATRKLMPWDYAIYFDAHSVASVVASVCPINIEDKAQVWYYFRDGEMYGPFSITQLSM